MRIRQDVEQTFGKSSLTDHVRIGSVWEDEEYYMAALSKGEAILLSRWHYDTGAELGQEIGEILLKADAPTRYQAFIVLQAKFNNYRECQKVIYRK